jgi:antirestriction protein ArdC
MTEPIKLPRMPATNGMREYARFAIEQATAEMQTEHRLEVELLRAEVERLRADRLSDINLHVMVLGQLFGVIDEGLINDAINLCAAAAKTCAQDIAEIEAASAKEKACKP